MPTSTTAFSTRSAAAAFLLLLLACSFAPRGQAVRHAPDPGPPTPAARQGVRRALLVGVGRYIPGGNTVCASSPAQLVIAQGSVAGRGMLRDLCGPREDVTKLSELLRARYGFRPENVKTLVDAQATRSKIIETFERELIGGASRGDTCLFYFSGHGSQRRNTLAPEDTERDRWDETLVTADVAQGVKDLRDKELAVLFHRALDKGVNLVVISDSCHSGSIARSAGTPVYQKNIRPDPADWKNEVCPDAGVEECRAREAVRAQLCPRPDPAAPARCLSPADRGALVLSASLEDQPAEVKLYGGDWHGAFTYGLLEVLKRPDMEAAAVKDLFSLVRTQIKADGLPQEPTSEPSVDGVSERVERRTLFGDEARPFDAIPAVRVKAVRGDDVILAAGLAHGLTEGSQLYGRDNKELRLSLEQPPGFTEAVAKLSGGDVSLLRTNDAFIPDRWAVPRKARLRVRLPPSNLTLAQVSRVGAEMLKLRESPRVRWLAEPTAENIDAQVFYKGGEWRLLVGEQDEAGLGVNPTAQQVLGRLPASDRPLKVLAKLPLARELREKLGIGTPGKTAVEVVTNDAESYQYELWGRAAGEPGRAGVEYSWVLRSAVGGQWSASPSAAPLPPVTDWAGLAADQDEAAQAAARTLDSLALRLGKIRSIVTLSDNVSKATSDKSWFPYRLVIREKATRRELSERDVLTQGVLYEAVLIPDREAFRHVLAETKRWVYLFNVDVSGASRRFNHLGDGQQASAVIYAPAAEPAEIVLKGPRCNPRLRQSLNCRAGEHVDLQVLPPSGLEVFQLVVTASPLPDPGVLNMEGVRAQFGARNFYNRNALQSLLFDLSGSEITFRGALPDEWWAQRMIFRSAPRP